MSRAAFQTRKIQKGESLTPGTDETPKPTREARGPITDEKSSPEPPQHARAAHGRPARVASAEASAGELPRAGLRLRLRGEPADSGRRVRLQDRGAAARARGVNRRAASAPARGRGELFARAA